VRLQSRSNTAALMMWTIGIPTDAGTYYTVPIAPQTLDVTFPTTPKDILVEFYKTGNRGDTGIVSVQSQDGVSLALAAGVLTGRRSNNLITPVLSGTVNDWTPTGFGPADLVELDGSGTINGLGIPGATDSREKLFALKFGATSATMKHDNSGSTAGCRIYCPDGKDLDFSIVTVARLRYLFGTINRWVVVSANTDFNKFFKDGSRALTGTLQFGGNAAAGVNYIDLGRHSGAIPGAPSSGSPGRGRVYVYANASNQVIGAPPNVRTQDDDLILDRGVAYVRGSAVGGATGNLDLDFSTLDSVDLSDGVFTVDIQLFGNNRSTSRSYNQPNLRKWLHYEMDVGGTNTSAQVMEAPLFSNVDTSPGTADGGAYWNGGNVDTSTIFIKHTIMGDGKTLQINWAMQPGGTDVWEYRLSVRISGFKGA
jgi:hypothetical protein